MSATTVTAPADGKAPPTSTATAAAAATTDPRSVPTELRCCRLSCSGPPRQSSHHHHTQPLKHTQPTPRPRVLRGLRGGAAAGRDHGAGGPGLIGAVLHLHLPLLPQRLARPLRAGACSVRVLCVCCVCSVWGGNSLVGQGAVSSDVIFSSPSLLPLPHTKPKPCPPQTQKQQRTGLRHRRQGRTGVGRRALARGGGREGRRGRGPEPAQQQRFQHQRRAGGGEGADGLHRDAGCGDLVAARGHRWVGARVCSVCL